MLNNRQRGGANGAGIQKTGRDWNVGKRPRNKVTRSERRGDSLRSYPGTRYPVTDGPALGGVVQGDPAGKVVPRSSQPCGFDQRANFEHLVTIGKVVLRQFRRLISSRLSRRVDRRAKSPVAN